MTFDSDQQLRALTQLVLASIDEHIAESQEMADEAAAQGRELTLQYYLESIEESKARRREVEARMPSD
ncbi:MAG TPA: hypothetical protein VFC00_25155 [Micromonosporaceae bacterium]|nr:hypothetical protein [Micromonosporaceae bacterium]